MTGLELNGVCEAGIVVENLHFFNTCTIDHHECKITTRRLTWLPEFGYGYGYDVICTWWMNTTCILGNCVVVFRYVNMDLDSSIFAEWIQLVQKTYVCVNNSVTVYSFTVIFISCLLIIKIRTIIAQHNYLRINVNFIHSPVPLLTSQHTCFAMCCSTTTTTCVQVTSLVILRLARFACSAPKLGLLIACFFPCMWYACCSVVHASRHVRDCSKMSRKLSEFGFVSKRRRAEDEEETGQNTRPPTTPCPTNLTASPRPVILKLGCTNMITVCCVVLCCVVWLHERSTHVTCHILSCVIDDGLCKQQSVEIKWGLKFTKFSLVNWTVRLLQP